MTGMFTVSVSSADGIHTQQPLEQRTNTRGTSASTNTSTRGDRSARGRGGHTRDVPSNDPVKPSPQQPATAPLPVSNDVAMESSAAAKPATVGMGKESGDSVKSTSDKPPTQSQSKPDIEPTLNNSESTGTEVTSSTAAVPVAGD